MAWRRGTAGGKQWKRRKK